MRLLLDSHVVLWWFNGGDRLSERATNAIRSAANQAYVSAATLWELAIKESIGKLEIDGDLREHLRAEDFSEVPITGDHAAATARLPFHHKDPFDRMLVAQAQCEQLTLVTADDTLTAYEVDILSAC